MPSRVIPEMRRRPYNVLVFDDDQTALHQLVTLLQQRDYVVKGTSSAEEARWWLSLRPIDLLIAAARMRGVGGLQFVATARAEQPELATILIGSAGDERFEMDAWRHGAALIMRPCDPAQVLMVVAETLASIRRRQRWPRKRLRTAVPVKVGGTVATLIDVSYGGVGFALEGESYDLPRPMTIEYPQGGLKITAELVWSSRASDGVRCLCGAAIVGDSPPPEWCQFVDRIPQRS